MGVGESLIQQLIARRESLRQYRFEFMPAPRDAGPHTASVDAGGATVDVVAADFGHQGLMFESLLVTGTAARPDGDSAGTLLERVERIVLETQTPYGPLRCIENDEGLNRAVLRTAVTVDGCYLEVVVEGGDVVEAKHYAVSARTRRRRRTPVNLGRRAFARLVDGLAGSFCPAEALR